MKETRFDTIIHELKHHAPFTLLISLIAGVIVAIFYSLGMNSLSFIGGLFEIIHPAHVLVSAAATSAIYYKYKKSFPKAIIVGIFGAIIVGTLSDVLLPYVVGNLFSLETTLHVPIIEEPIIILGAALVGAVLGKIEGLFKLEHSAHVFLSVFASLFYILAFSISVSVWAVLLISLIVFLVVYIPCCISDIVFPILFIKRPCKDCGHWHG